MSAQANSLTGMTPPEGVQAGGLFSKIGATLKQVMPYVTPIANRLAAAAGNYGPIELEHQQREDALKQQLAQSQMDTANLNRSLLQKQVENYQTPEQQDARAVAQAGALEDVKTTHGPGTVTSAPLPAGGYGMFRVKGTNAEPIMTHQEVPNPTQAPGAGMPPPTMPPLVPPSPTVNQSSQLMALQKGLTRGQPIRQPDGSYAIPVYNAQQHIDHYETEAGTPLSQIPQSEVTNTNSIQHDQNNNLVNVPKTTSKTKGPAPIAGGGANPAVPPTHPAIPGGGNQATPIMGTDGQPLHAPLGADAKKTLRQVSTSGQMIDSILPDLTAAVSDIGRGSNIYDAVKTRDSWLEYNKGLDPNNIDPNSPVSALPGTDPRITKMFPAIAMMKVVLAQPFMNNSRNFQFMQQIQQHVPDPEKDTPQLMLSKAQWIKTALPMIKKAVYDSEGIQTPNAAAPSSNSGKWNPIKGVYE